jgi:hypothetical protein
MPPLDRHRKIRRDIIYTINDYRARAGVPKLYIDVVGNNCAMEYAQYLLDGPESEEKLQECM